MRQETQWTTIFWEGWTALALCAAAVFWPGSAALGYPAVLWPGLALAAAVPVLWAGWWLWAEKAPPLPPPKLSLYYLRHILNPCPGDTPDPLWLAIKANPVSSSLRHGATFRRAHQHGVSISVCGL